MFFRNLNFFAAFLIFFGAAARRGSPTKDSFPVVVSLKPLHSLTCALMEGRGCPPDLMLEGNVSANDATLRPRDLLLLKRVNL